MKKVKRTRISFAREIRETRIGDFTNLPEITHENFRELLPAIERGLLVASKSEERVTFSQLIHGGYALQVDGYRGKTWCSYWVGYDARRDVYVARVTDWNKSEY